MFFRIRALIQNLWSGDPIEEEIVPQDAPRAAMRQKARYIKEPQILEPQVLPDSAMMHIIKAQSAVSFYTEKERLCALSFSEKLKFSRDSTKLGMKGVLEGSSAINGVVFRPIVGDFHTKRAAYIQEKLLKIALTSELRIDRLFIQYFETMEALIEGLSMLSDGAWKILKIGPMENDAMQDRVFISYIAEQKQYVDAIRMRLYLLLDDPTNIDKNFCQYIQKMLSVTVEAFRKKEASVAAQYFKQLMQIENALAECLEASEDGLDRIQICLGQIDFFIDLSEKIAALSALTIEIKDTQATFEKIEDESEESIKISTLRCLAALDSEVQQQNLDPLFLKKVQQCIAAERPGLLSLIIEKLRTSNDPILSVWLDRWIVDVAEEFDQSGKPLYGDFEGVTADALAVMIEREKIKDLFKRLGSMHTLSCETLFTNVKKVIDLSSEMVQLSRQYVDKEITILQKRGMELEESSKLKKHIDDFFYCPDGTAIHIVEAKSIIENLETEASLSMSTAFAQWMLHRAKNFVEQALKGLSLSSEDRANLQAATVHQVWLEKVQGDFGHVSRASKNQKRMPLFQEDTSGVYTEVTKREVLPPLPVCKYDKSSVELYFSAASKKPAPPDISNPKDKTPKELLQWMYESCAASSLLAANYKTIFRALKVLPVNYTELDAKQLQLRKLREAYVVAAARSHTDLRQIGAFHAHVEAFGRILHAIEFSPLMKTTYLL